MSGVINAITKPVKQVLGSLTGANAAKSAQREADRAAREAQAQEAQIAARQEQQQLALQNMQANAQVDLTTDNLTSVIAGGSADLSGVGTDAMKKKRPPGGLASSLGLNV